MAPLERFVCYLAILLASASFTFSQVSVQWENLEDTARIGSFPKAFQRPPPESPAYMVDNTGNKRGVAPIKGEYNGAVWKESGSFENYMKKLAEKKAAGLVPNSTVGEPPVRVGEKLESRQGGGFWLTSLGPLGKAPHAGDGYVFYRNVLDYGADNTGATNTEEAINAAIIDGDRCGEECGNTFVLGALIYFPPGTYKVCTPIIQYYLTQFVGDPNDRPIIKGCDEFTGIALMDVDPYVPNQAQPDGTGVNWYINQNQFFRQIRNFVFDLTEMPASTAEHDQPLVPTGIHWQVSQACSLQNLLFKMPTSGIDGDPPTHVGVFTENGSGGFVSDLEFEGGAIGWRVGSQQYTATSLKFRNCITAVQMVWDWGFNWHKIDIEGGSIAFNISGRGGIDGQGIGSVSIIDSTVSNVPIGILTNDHATAPPNIVIDNTDFNNVGAIVAVENGRTLLEGGSTNVALWAHGRRYIGGEGERATGHVSNRPTKPTALLDGSGKLFTRLRPQYENLPASAFLIATEHGCRNDATGDNTAAINAFLRQAVSQGKVAYFPAGIYPVQGTVTFPTGSKIQGTGWSQIQATGSYFGDMENPKVVVRVGEEGDVGTMEIVDMLFTAKGPTAGAIMMEWNVHESSQGAAGLWDSHIRIGGGIGTDLDMETCPKYSEKDVCICVSLLLHITKQASAYLENFWAWVADHDNDYVMYWELDSSKSQIALFGARGVLIESQGPVWIYGSGSEHVIFYQYEMLGAKNVYLGHIQTESPYMQPKPVSPSPMEKALGVLPGDPDWSHCTKETCEMAWGLRIIDSEGIMLHSAGLYSWFNDYTQGCLKSENCQEKVMEVRGSKGVSIFNIFSKAVEEIGTGNTNESSIWLEGNKQGYTSEISLWFPEDGDPNGEVVYIGPEVYTTNTAQCPAAPCVFVMPPTTLPSATTITVKPYVTELEVGASSGTTFVVTTTTVTITVQAITTTVVPVSNHNITRGQEPGDTFYVTPSVTFEPTGIPLTKPDGQVTTRTITLPPWPQINSWTTGGSSSNGTTGGGVTTRPSGPSTITFPPVTTYTQALTLTCPPSVHYVPYYSAKITLSSCSAGSTTLPWDCAATETVEINEPTTVDFTLGCTRWTGTSEPIPTMTEFPPGLELEWIEEYNEDDHEDDESTCDLWFFSICINWDTIKIRGWHWDFPGPIIIIGPPRIKWPKGVEITGVLPGPWPPITIQSGTAIIPTNKPPNCETQTADICSTSTFISTTVSQGTTRTLTTRVTSTCETIFGCVLTDGDYDTTSKTGKTCGKPTQGLPTGIPGIPFGALAVDTTTTPSEPAAASETSSSTASGISAISSGASTAASEPEDSHNSTAISSRGELVRRDLPLDGRHHYMIWIKDSPTGDSYADAIRLWLRGTSTEMDGRTNYGDYKEIIANDWNNGNPATLLIFVRNMLECHAAQLQNDHNGAILEMRTLMLRPPPSDDSSTGSGGSESSRKHRRAAVNHGEDSEYYFWELPQISVAPGEEWEGEWDTEDRDRHSGMSYFVDDSFGAGQTIYMLEDDWYRNNEEFEDTSDLGGDSGELTRPPIQELPDFDWGEGLDSESGIDHGTGVLSKITGWNLGLAKRAQVIVVRNRRISTVYEHVERWFESWVRVLNHVQQLYANDPTQRGKVIATTSYALESWQEVMGPGMYDRLRDVFKKLDDLDVVMVLTTHNELLELGDDLENCVPEVYAHPNSPADWRIDNLIIVGGSDATGRRSPISPWDDWLVIAPGYQVFINEGGLPQSLQSGNSYATPLVAGLVAYWRGLPNIANGWGEELKRPANVKRLLRYMQRPIEDHNLPEGLDESQVDLPDGFPRDQWFKVPFIWTGAFEDMNCLQTPDEHSSCPSGSLEDLEPFGAGCQSYDAGSDSGAGSGSDSARAGGRACVLNPGNGNGGGNGPGPDAIGDAVTYTPGPASPTCVPGSPGCGTLCTGYYCVPSPTGYPPDHWDPEDPEHLPTSITKDPPSSTRGPTISRSSTIGPPISFSSTSRSSTIGPPITKTDPPLPTLSSSEEPFSGPGCATYTSTTQCNGSGGQAACVTGRLCVPKQPCPSFATKGKPLCPSDYPVCLGTTIYSRCAQNSMAGVMAEPTEPPSPPDTGSQPQDHHEQQQEEKRDLENPASDYDSLDMSESFGTDVSPLNTTGLVTTDHLLGRRQNAPGCNNCEYFVNCRPGFCSRFESWSCIIGSVKARMHPIDTVLRLTIYENFELKCDISMSCLTANVPDCLVEQADKEHDCGNGNKILSWKNLDTVEYMSGIDGNKYMVYMGPDGPQVYDICFVAPRFYALCIDSAYGATAGACPDPARVKAIEQEAKLLELDG